MKKSINTETLGIIVTVNNMMDKKEKRRDMVIKRKI